MRHRPDCRVNYDRECGLCTCGGGTMRRGAEESERRDQMLREALTALEELNQLLPKEVGDRAFTLLDAARSKVVTVLNPFCWTGER